MCKVTALTGENSGFGRGSSCAWINGDYLGFRRIDLRNDHGSFIRHHKLKKVVPYVDTNGIDLRNDHGSFIRHHKLKKVVPYVDTNGIDLFL
jgi:hypothetical protein